MEFRTFDGPEVMLHKFLQIENVGRFKNYRPGGDVDFRRITVVFGENGRGKSTLTAILRSLATNDPDHVLARARLPLSGKLKVTILRAGNAKSTFSETAWDCAVPDVEVFDQHFTETNVCSGLTVNSDHRRNLYDVIVGERGVVLARTVVELDESIRVTTSAVKSAEKGLAPHVPLSMKSEMYIAIQPVDNVDEAIQKAKSHVAIAQAATRIIKAAPFHLVSPPALPSLDILEETLDNVSQEAIEGVTRHLSQIGVDGEHWLAVGMDLPVADMCPFCGQDTSAIALLKAYRGYFSEAYSDLKHRISDLSDELDQTIGPVSMEPIFTDIVSNNTALDFWSQHVACDGLSFDAEPLRLAAGRLYTLMAETFIAKSGRPLEPIETTKELRLALDEYRRLSEEALEYNARCGAANLQISEVKKAATESKPDEAARSLQMLELSKKRHTPAIDAVCRDYSAAVAMKALLEAKKVAARKALDEYTEEVFAKHQGTMNQHLLRLNAEFRIANSTYSHKGGTPRSVYSIEINSCSVPLEGKPHENTFASTLSGGDKSCLALAFFLSRLDHDPRISDKIIVFDDPMCSMDRFRANRTVSIVREYASRAKQLIILSHDSVFLKNVWNQFEKGEKRAVTVRGTNAGESTIEEWEIDLDTQSGYLKKFDAIRGYERDGSGLKENVAQSIRPLLEEYLRVRFPNEFKPGEWLGDFLEKIRVAGPGSPLVRMQAQLQELTELNDYSKRFHHAPVESPNEGELRGYAGRIITFVTQ